MVERAGICYVIFFVLLLSALHNGSKRLEAMDDALHPLRTFFHRELLPYFRLG